jgi:hypothetical protein
MRMMLTFALLALPLAASAQEHYYPYLDARTQCQQADGSWSNFKHRCDLTHKRFFKDPKTWTALAILGTNVTIVTASANNVKAGGTFIFGNNTSTGGLVGIGIGTFVAMTGFQRINWYLGHDDPDCPKGPWCNMSYFLLPALVSGATAWEMTSTNWGHNPGLKPLPLPYLKRDWLYDMRKH